jgi:DNA-binding transcriptional ArsR family regulator
MDLPETLKLLSDRNRLRILSLLEGREPCVCDLEAALMISQANLSRHLARLRRAGLVEATKRGMFVYYHRSPLPGGPAGTALAGIYAALGGDGSFGDDRRRLQAFLAAKPDGHCGPAPSPERRAAD